MIEDLILGSIALLIGPFAALLVFIYIDRKSGPK